MTLIFGVVSVSVKEQTKNMFKVKKKSKQKASAKNDFKTKIMVKMKMTIKHTQYMRFLNSTHYPDQIYCITAHHKLSLYVLFLLPVISKKKSF